MSIGCSNEAIGKKGMEHGIKQEMIDKQMKGMEDYGSGNEVDLSHINQHTHQWGERVSGVLTKLKTDEKVIALTFDACGGPYGSEYDEALLTFLIEEEIPATLFVNQRWIHENRDTFKELAQNPLFQIENHGTEHLPLSVNGQSAWGIKGTSSPEEVVEEVLGNQEEIKRLTRRSPTLFRSGTAFYDEEAVKIVKELGLQVVNYSLLGDAGGTYSANAVASALLQASPGDIALLHMNQPNSGTGKGVKTAIPLLKEAGFSFVLLQDFELE